MAPNEIKARTTIYSPHLDSLTVCDNSNIGLCLSCMIGNVGDSVKCRSLQFPVKSCNCRSLEICPLKGFFIATDVVYKCMVKEGNNSDRFYKGSTLNSKARYCVHLSSFKEERYCNSTTLASHIYYLNKNNKNYSLEWSLISRASSFKANIEKCRLCTQGSLASLKSFGPKSFNKFKDVIPFCNHKFSSMSLKIYKGKIRNIKS